MTIRSIIVIIMNSWFSSLSSLSASSSSIRHVGFQRCSQTLK